MMNARCVIPVADFILVARRAMCFKMTVVTCALAALNSVRLSNSV
jgi:hypothetical protein